jgi:hypothetical protein
MLIVVVLYSVRPEQAHDLARRNMKAELLPPPVRRRTICQALDPRTHGSGGIIAPSYQAAGSKRQAAVEYAPRLSRFVAASPAAINSTALSGQRALEI